MHACKNINSSFVRTEQTGIHVKTRVRVRVAPAQQQSGQYGQGQSVHPFRYNRCSVCKINSAVRARPEKRAATRRCLSLFLFPTGVGRPGDALRRQKPPPVSRFNGQLADIEMCNNHLLHIVRNVYIRTISRKLWYSNLII